MLQQISQKQEMIMQQMGPDNPLVNAQNYYSTMTAMLELAGFKDINRFFSDPAQYQAPPPQEPPPDPNQALIEVQMQSIQADIQKKQAELELDREKMIREDDRRRDRDEADVLLKAAELTARYGAQVDVAQIRSNTERDRELMRQMASVNNGQNRPPIS